MSENRKQVHVYRCNTSHCGKAEVSKANKKAAKRRANGLIGQFSQNSEHQTHRVKEKSAGRDGPRRIPRWDVRVWSEVGLQRHMAKFCRHHKLMVSHSHSAGPDDCKPWPMAPMGRAPRFCPGKGLDVAMAVSFLRNSALPLVSSASAISSSCDSLLLCPRFRLGATATPRD